MPTVREAVWVIAFVLVLSLIGLMAWGLHNKAPVTGMSGFTRVQHPAPDFILPLLDGGELTLSESAGRPVVINFWASWCPPCRVEAATLERTWRSYGDDGVLFVGVNIQDTETLAASYLRDFGITYPNGQDLDGRITIDYGVVGLPVTFLVDREGIIVKRWVGAITETQLIAWVDEIVSDAHLSGESEGTSEDGFYRFDQDK